MLRTGAPRSAFRTLTTFSALSGRTSFNASSTGSQFSSKLCTLSKTRPVALGKPLTLALVRHQSRGAMDNIDSKNEHKIAGQKLEAHPDLVSSTSSTHGIFTEVGMREDQEKDTDMMAGVKQDLKTIRETFSLESVPREAYNVGMAGVLPYVATSLSTVYAAWEINHAHATGAGLLMNEKTAELALHLLEPLQVGYGAVIISFLGAIHWGLEWAGFGGYQGYRRYGIGIAATAVAWPTILLPVEYALITQFLAFNFLYYADSRACKRGWAPSWYGVYRFVLTFIVGGAIVVSLIGRGQIADRIGKLPGPADRIKALRDSQVQALEEEEAARRAKIISKDEDEDEDDE